MEPREKKMNPHQTTRKMPHKMNQPLKLPKSQERGAPRKKKLPPRKRTQQNQSPRKSPKLHLNLRKRNLLKRRKRKEILKRKKRIVKWLSF